MVRTMLHKKSLKKFFSSKICSISNFKRQFANVLLESEGEKKVLKIKLKKNCLYFYIITTTMLVCKQHSVCHTFITFNQTIT